MTCGLIIVIAGIACGGDKPEPMAPDNPAGTLEVVFNTPFADDGIARVTIQGGVMTSVSATAGLTTYMNQAAGRLQVVVAGDLADGTVIVRFNVPNVADAGLYSGTVEEAAAKTTYHQRSLSSHSLSIRESR